MAGVTDKEIGVARVYGSAILELAEARHSAEALLEELQALGSVLARDRGFAHFLASPMTDTKQKGEVIERVFRGRASDLLVDALQIVNRKGRLDLLPAVIEGYRRLLAELRGRVDVHVSSATPLTDALRGRLREVAAALSGKDPQLQEAVDPSLIGGLVMQIGDVKYDSSVARRLRTVGDSLALRASEEIHGGRAYWSS
jgi:F-type H+-transporting ATPase subunit delta